MAESPIGTGASGWDTALVPALVRRSLALVAAVAVVACAGAAPAAAAPVFTLVGQTAPGEFNGGCPAVCSVVQRATSPAGAYALPYDGVLTRFSVRKGSSIATFGGEWMRARTFRLGDATHARVISESAQADLDPATPSTTQTFWDRISATAGDVLGAKFHTGAFIAETPHVFTATTTASDSAAADSTSPGPGVGEDAVGTAFPSLRVNVSARLEHDADHDGYGDGSQDLCLGDTAHATGACSGALFGSNLQGAYKQVGFSCGYACARVQLTSSGVSTSPAVDGVVVRWRLQAPTAGTYHIVILEPAAGGGFTFARVSDTVTIPADEALWTFPARLSIKAGGYVAFVPPPFAIEASFMTTPAGATYTNVAGDAAVGSSTPIPSGIAGAFLYDADIEPDADHDGYGDVTQDACPTNATTHGACPIPPPPASSVTPLTATLTAFTVGNRRFRVDRKGPVGRALRASSSSRPHPGTTLKATLSRAATVRFSVLRLSTGVRKGGTCRAGRPKKGDRRCTIRKTVHILSAALPAGAGSGRYRRNGHIRALTAGRYRIDAAVVSAAGAVGKARSVTVTVVR